MNDQVRTDGNELEVDQAALAGEAAALDAAGLEVPPDTMTPGVDEAGAGAPSDGGASAPVPASWAPYTPPLLELVDKLVCPAWELSDAEKRDVADALAPVLDQLFPGGLGSERWAPYFRLAIVAGLVVMQRYDGKAGKFRPLRKARADSSSSDSSPPAQPGAGDDPAGAGGSFSTAPH